MHLFFFIDNITILLIAVDCHSNSWCSNNYISVQTELEDLYFKLFTGISKLTFGHENALPISRNKLLLEREINIRLTVLIH